MIDWDLEDVRPFEQVNILPYLTEDEQVAAVRNAGGIASAYRYVTGDRL